MFVLYLGKTGVNWVPCIKMNPIIANLFLYFIRSGNEIYIEPEVFFFLEVDAFGNVFCFSCFFVHVCLFFQLQRSEDS